MRFAIHALTVFAVLGVAESSLGQGITQIDTKELAGSLQSADNAVRRRALEQFEKKVKRTLSPGNKPMSSEAVTAIDQSMPLLGKALIDPDPDVRRAALAPLNDIATHQQAVTRGANPREPDLTTEPSIRENLIKLMSDPDVETIRLPATAIYAQSFPPTPELEQQWMAEYEPGQSSANRIILAALLLNGSPSAVAKAFVLGKLQSPATAYDAAEEIILCLKPPPPEALPLMVQQFAASDKAAYRAFLAQAVPKFGTAARNYLPVLQDMLAREADSIVRGNLINAISKITGQAPQTSNLSTIGPVENTQATPATPSTSIADSDTPRSPNVTSHSAAPSKKVWFLAPAALVILGVLTYFGRRAG